MTWLGLDIGGANLKVADGQGFALSRPFAMWREPEGLCDCLRALLRECPPADRLAVTMTGELADCFPTRAHGVSAIVEAVVEAAGGRHVTFYRTDGCFADAEAACQQPELVASANWHALASFVARNVDGRGILIDVGSTTADIIRLRNGQPDPTGLTDTERLLSSELVYCGVWRTPIAGIVQTVPWRTRNCPVAKEMFATTLDVYLMLGDITEDPQSSNTADGRPATRAAAQARLARMICADRDSFHVEDALATANCVADKLQATLISALSTVSEAMPEPPQSIVVSGAGEFLAARVARRVFPDSNVVSLAQRLGNDVSTCAPAHAVASLAEETCR
ncbi:MAG: hydantoinase/oxoprolinase family protein [Pirellulales bacterium]|nr:hydantoinase/oxoprolinase family protein [Pirellulales bacterium]